MTLLVELPLTHQFIAQAALLGMGFDALGGCYLAYDLLGGKRGPLRAIARAAGYIALFVFGYAVVLGLRFALIAGSGLGILLAFEIRYVVVGNPKRRTRAVFVFGFLRGVVLGLAAMPVSGPEYGALFGILSGLGLGSLNAIGFAPADDYETKAKPHLSTHKLLASLYRALIVGVAGVIAGLFVASSAALGALFGLRLGLTSGTVSALIALFSPVIEWQIENLPARRLGLWGLVLIFIGMVLQSTQYWIVVFDLPTR